MRLAYDVGQAHAGVLGGGVHGAAHAQGAHRRLSGQRAGAQRRVSRRRARRIAGRRLVGRRREVALVQKREHAVQVQIAVEREVAVVRAVVARVLLQEPLVGEVGDGARRAAGLEAVGRVGEERRLQLVVEHGVRVGERAFHLVVHHAVEAKAGRVALGASGGRRTVCDVGGGWRFRARRARAALRRFCAAALAARRAVVRRVACRRALVFVPLAVRKLHVPALLLEDGALAVDQGMQHRVQVHVHEVEQVLLVGAGHRVHGLVRKGHGVQKRLHGAFEQVHERLLDGEAVAAAQHRVLQDVEHAGVVGGRRLEGDGERLVRVVVGKVEQLRAAFGVVEHVGGAVYLRQLFARAHGEAVQGLVRGKIHGWCRLSYDACRVSPHCLTTRPGGAPRTPSASETPENGRDRAFLSSFVPRPLRSRTSPFPNKGAKGTLARVPGTIEGTFVLHSADKARFSAVALATGRTRAWWWNRRV